VHVNPAGVKSLISPSFQASLGSPPLNFPQRGPISVAIEVPAVEGMAPQALSPSHQQSVAGRRQRSVADIQLAAAGMERQRASHGMDGTIEVTE
jgi:hypothetical protein